MNDVHQPEPEAFFALGRTGIREYEEKERTGTQLFDL